MSFLLDKNPAGFFSLKKLTSDGIYHTVLPLGMDETKATSDALMYIAKNEPNAELSMVNKRLVELLDTIIPFKAHRGKAIKEVLETHPDYLQWVLTAHDDDHKVIGDVVKALKELKSSFGVVLFGVTAGQASSAKVEDVVSSFCDVSVGQEISFNFKIKNLKIIPPIKNRKHGKDVYRMALLGAENESYIAFSSGRVVNHLKAVEALGGTRTLNGKAIANKVSTYNGVEELQIKGLMLNPLTYFGVRLEFTHAEEATLEFIKNQLNSYKCIDSPLLLGKEIVQVSLSIGSSDEGIRKLKKGEAILKLNMSCELYGKDLTDLLRMTFINRHDGLLGITGQICSLPVS